MKKSKLSGWKDVFKFTLTQTVKSKSFIVSFCILFILSVVAMPIVSKVFGNSSEANGVSKIEKVYVNNESKLSDTSFLPTIEDENYAHITFVDLNEDYDALLKKIDETETTSVVLDITEVEYNQYSKGYELHFTKSSNGDVTKSEVQELGELVSQAFYDYRIDVLGIEQSQLDLINSEVSTNVIMTDVNGAEIIEEDTTITMTQYWIVYGIFFVVMMVTTLASTQIASSIASDKSTRVVEYLLTSVKPLALMVGKILAMLVAVLGQTVILIIGVAVSNKVTTSLFGGEDMLQKMLPADIFANLNVLNIIICIIVIGLGLIFYGTLAGLAGATVSKIEELNEGLTLYMVGNMAGAYIGIIAASTLMGAGMNGFVTFALLFPLSSPYLLPGAIMIGSVSAGMAALAIALQFVFIFLLVRFTAKIYETLILHTGNTITVKQLFGMAKSMKKEAK